MSAFDLSADRPFEDAEFVLYRTDGDHAESEASTEWAQELGIVSFSLWIRWPDENVEIPLWHQAEQGGWLSLDVDTYRPDPGEPVSDGFVTVLGNLPAAIERQTWPDPAEAAWDDCSDLERLLVHRFQDAFARGEPAEALAVVDECHHRMSDTEVVE